MITAKLPFDPLGFPDQLITLTMAFQDIPACNHYTSFIGRTAFLRDKPKPLTEDEKKLYEVYENIDVKYGNFSLGALAKKQDF